MRGYFIFLMIERVSKPIISHMAVLSCIALRDSQSFFLYDINCVLAFIRLGG